MMKKDLKSDDFPDLKWETGKLADPLSQLCGYATLQAQNAINWYYSSRQARRYFCRVCRFGAILLTAFAGLLPLGNEIVGIRETSSSAPIAFTNDVGREGAAQTTAGVPTVSFAKRHTLNPLWSAIAIAIAGTLIIIDRFYGFTT